MCTITNRSELNEANGFKVVIKKDGEYYSPYTGIKYEVGMKIPKINKTINKDISLISQVFERGQPYYNFMMVGRTGVFTSFDEAKRAYWSFAKSYQRKLVFNSGRLNRENYQIKILRMKIGGGIWLGYTHINFNKKYVMIGSEILEMEEVL